MDEGEVWMQRDTGDAVLSAQVREIVVADLRQKAEGGRRKAEGGRRKAEGGRQKAEGGRDMMLGSCCQVHRHTVIAFIKFFVFLLTKILGFALV